MPGNGLRLDCALVHSGKQGYTRFGSPRMDRAAGVRLGPRRLF
jgi:hypothetical protein